MRSRVANLIAIALLGAVASCGNLTCDQDKKDAIKQNNAGVDALRAKTYSIAEKHFEQALSLDPEYDVAAYNLGQAYDGDKKYDRAAEAYSKAVKINDKEAMYHYKLGKAYLELDKTDMARTELEKAVQLNGRLFKVHWYLGKIHEAQDRPKEAAQAYSESARLDPGFGKPFYNLGLLYYKWDHIDQCISVLEQGKQHARDPEDKTNIQHQLGLAYHSKKDYDKAIAAYEAAIAAKGDNIEARLQIGNAYADKGDKAKAKQYLDEFIKLGGGGNPFLIQSAHERLLRIAAGM